jgi:hypothetical protein
MALSETQFTRVNEALTALQAVRDEFKDVLVVLDYATIADIDNTQIDHDAGDVAGDALTPAQLDAVLWRLGKHVGGDETSHSLLPAMVQFELDEQERRETPQAE